MVWVGINLIGDTNLCICFLQDLPQLNQMYRYDIVDSQTDHIDVTEYYFVSIDGNFVGERIDDFLDEQGIQWN